jgi:hypothetical protein
MQKLLKNLLVAVLCFGVLVPEPKKPVSDSVKTVKPVSDSVRVFVHQ